MRIGGNIDTHYNNPEEWLSLIRDLDYSCVLSPVPKSAAGEQEIQSYLTAAKEHDIIIGEVGIWNNMIAPDKAERREALRYSIERLQLAEALSANCCVNTGGSRAGDSFSLHKDNFSVDTYYLLVKGVREIIDAVQPVNTFFTLEPMPWMTPASPEEYIKLIEDVDRPSFGVHLDFVNMINTPEKFAFRDEFIDSCFEILGDHIKSVHLKDIKQIEGIPFSFAVTECRPGEGVLDFGPVLKRCESLAEDMTVFVEHMNSHEEYKETVAYVRDLSRAAGVDIKHIT